MFSAVLFAIIRTLFPVTMQQSPVKDFEDLEPIARVDSADEELAKPFREFLESFGTRVAGATKEGKKLTYYLLVGDVDFVKDKAERIFPKPERTVLILYGSSPTTSNLLSSKFHAKVILIDPKIPGSRLVSEIFAFFFTSKENFLDLRTDKSEKSQLVEKMDYQNIDYSSGDKERIKKSIDTIFAKEVNGKIKEEKKSPKKYNKKIGFIARVFLTLIFVLVILFFPFIWYGTGVVLAGGSLVLAAREIYSGNVSLGLRLNNFAGSWINQSSFSLSLAGISFKLANRYETVRNQERLLAFFADINGALRNVSALSDKGREVASLMLTTASGSVDTSDNQGAPALALSQLQSEILSEEEKLGMAATELSYVLANNTFPFSIAKIRNFGIKAQSQLGTVRQNINYINNFLSLYPDLAGFKSKKTYLILFQNSLELRPTGGFIGSIGTVSFDAGRLSDLTIQDVYELDGQLKGHVDPPAPIRDLLGEEHWYLRDSNWDPDFTKSATRAAWFYEKETEKTVDGVMAVSSPFLVDMLRATGPIELRDYNDRITSENFYGKSLYYTQNNFFPGSTQKKDFLGSLANAIIGKVTSEQGSADPHVFFTAAGALNRGDILMYFSDPQVENIVSRFGWAGINPKIFPCLPEAQACLSDSISVTEANLGVNKANFYVNRQVNNKITLSENGNMETTTSIDFQNKSSADHPSNGSGAYKVYLRFILPGDTTFVGGAFGTTNLVKHQTNKIVVLPYYDESIINGQKVIGVAMVIPEAAERRLVMTFKRTKGLIFSGGSSDYRFIYDRQPGTANTTVETQIIYPIFWTADQVIGQGQLTFLAKQAQLTYNTDLSQDEKLEVKFSK